MTKASVPYILIFMALMFFAPLKVVYAQDLFPAVPSIGVTNSAAHLKDAANRFYKRCHQKPDATLSTEAQEEYCVCLSAQVYRKTLTAEEREYLATGEGVPMDYKRSIAEVYGQCIGIPGRAATYNECSHSYKAYKMVKSAEDLNAMCQCMINKMSDFWDVMAPALLEAEIARGRDVGDPLNHIINGRNYPVQYSQIRSECVSVYGRRD